MPSCGLMAKEMANGCHLLRKNTNIFLYVQLLDTLLEIINRKAGMMRLAVCLQKLRMAATALPCTKLYKMQILGDKLKAHCFYFMITVLPLIT